MRTAILLTTGLVLLLVSQRMSGLFGGKTRAAMIFIAVWLTATMINLYIGTTHGYTVLDEAPIFLLLFGVPAAAALWLLRRPA